VRARGAYDDVIPFSGFSKRERVIQTHTQAVHSKQETSYEGIKSIEKSSIFSSYSSVGRGARRDEGSEKEKSGRKYNREARLRNARRLLQDGISRFKFSLYCVTLTLFCPPDGDRFSVVT